MKNKISSLFLAVIVSFIFIPAASAQNAPNWTEKQLMEPAILANEIKENKELPYIISVGPGAIIPASHKMGMASTPEGISTLSATLDSLPKNTKIVIYCGCCPFEHCPNVRPAIDALKAKGFTDYSLLNLSTNIKTDWISKGYPTVN